MLKKITQNSSYLVVSAIIIKLSYFAWGAFIARSLGPEVFGEFTFLSAFTVLFTTVPDLGLGLILIRQLSRSFSQTVSQWFTYRLFNHATSVTLVPLITATLLLTNPHHIATSSIIMATTLFCLSQMRSPYLVIMQAKEQFFSFAIADLLNVLLPIIMSLLTIAISPNLNGILSGQLIGMFTSLFITARLANITSTSNHPFSITILKQLLAVSLPLGLAAFFGIITAKIDQLFIANLLSTTQLGIFAVANSIISGVTGIFSNPFSSVTLPILSKGTSKSVIFTISSTALLLGFGLSGLILIFSPLVISTAFGSAFRTAILPTQILSGSLIFLFLNRVLEQLLLVKHHEKLYLLFNLLGAMVTIFLNAVLIRTYGLIGAAYSRLGSQFFISVILAIIVYHLITRHGHQAKILDRFQKKTQPKRIPSH